MPPPHSHSFFDENFVLKIAHISFLAENVVFLIAHITFLAENVCFFNTLATPPPPKYIDDPECMKISNAYMDHNFAYIIHNDNATDFKFNPWVQ